MATEKGARRRRSVAAASELYARRQFGLTGLYALGSDLLRDLLEGLADLALPLIPFPDRRVRRATFVKDA